MKHTISDSAKYSIRKETMLENEFYKLITPEGRQNYILEDQAKMLLLLCQAVDKLIAHSHANLSSAGSFSAICPKCGTFIGADSAKLVDK